MLEWDKSLYFVGLDRATTVNVVLPSVTTIRLLLVMYWEKANWILTITRHVAGTREKVCRPSPYLNGMRLRPQLLERGAVYFFHSFQRVSTTVLTIWPDHIFSVLLPSLMLLRPLPQISLPLRLVPLSSMTCWTLGLDRSSSSHHNHQH